MADQTMPRVPRADRWALTLTLVLVTAALVAGGMLLIRSWPPPTADFGFVGFQAPIAIGFAASQA